MGRETERGVTSSLIISMCFALTLDRHLVVPFFRRVHCCSHIIRRPRTLDPILTHAIHPGHVAQTYSASFCHFASILQSLLHAGTWIIRRHLARECRRFPPCISAQFVCLCVTECLSLLHTDWLFAWRRSTPPFAPPNAEWSRRCERQGLCGSDIL